MITDDQRHALEQIQAAPSRFHNLSDAGNALRFADQHGHRLRFNAASGKWLIWSYSFWSEDRDGEVIRLAKATARSIFAEAAAEEDEGTRKKLAGHAVKTEAKSRLEAMVALAASEPGIVVLPEQLDKNPDLLACPNVTIDLRTGEAKAPDPADLITRSTGIHFDPDAECPRFLRFLLEVFEGDQELADFIQRWVGYILTGHTVEHAFLLAYGPKGRGGKSVLANVLRKLLGDYAAVADFETFTRSRGDQGPRNDLARLDGVRAVFASEGQAGRRLDEATVKQLTGGDPVVARFLYAETFEYLPQFKLWLTTNRRPRIDGGDEAIWSRVREIPFMADFRGREDRNLEQTLQAELPGILNWAIQGTLKWRKHGLGSAKAIEESTADYRAGEDILGSFLADRCELDGETPTATLREAFEAYCEEIGEDPPNARIIGRELATRGITRGGAGRRFYQEVRVK